MTEIWGYIFEVHTNNLDLVTEPNLKKYSGDISATDVEMLVYRAVFGDKTAGGKMQTAPWTSH